MTIPKGWLARLMTGSSHKPSTPTGTQVYAIGDIHGRLDLLLQLLDKIWSHAAAHSGAKTLVLLGDYVDRGPDSRGVIAHIRSLQRPAWEIIALRGNHDQQVLDFCGDPAIYRAWRDFGGGETLRSYGVRPPRFDDPTEFARARLEFVKVIPTADLGFLEALPYSHTIGDYLFAHAGVRPGIALDQQSPEDLMWIRDEFLSSERRLGKVVVHGHSPSERPVVRPNHIGVDTGAYATNRLTAVVLDGESRLFLSTGDA